MTAPNWGIGIDIESVERFRNDVRTSSRLLSTAFSKREREYCLSKADPAVHFSGTFAAKEAVLKALSGLGIGSHVVMGFEVHHDRSGRPYVKYYVKNTRSLRGVEIRIAISHTTDNAVAVAIAIIDKRSPSKSR